MIHPTAYLKFDLSIVFDCYVFDFKITVKFIDVATSLLIYCFQITTCLFVAIFIHFVVDTNRLDASSPTNSFRFFLVPLQLQILLLLRPKVRPQNFNLRSNLSYVCPIMLHFCCPFLCLIKCEPSSDYLTEVRFSRFKITE